jgi:hypothetical protein
MEQTIVTTDASKRYDMNAPAVQWCRVAGEATEPHDRKYAPYAGGVRKPEGDAYERAYEATAFLLHAITHGSATIDNAVFVNDGGARYADKTIDDIEGKICMVVKKKGESLTLDGVNAEAVLNNILNVAAHGFGAKWMAEVAQKGWEMLNTMTHVPAQVGQKTFRTGTDVNTLAYMVKTVFSNAKSTSAPTTTRNLRKSTVKNAWLKHAGNGDKGFNAWWEGIFADARFDADVNSGNWSDDASKKQAILTTALEMATANEMRVDTPALPTIPNPLPAISAPVTAPAETTVVAAPAPGGIDLNAKIAALKGMGMSDEAIADAIMRL